MKMIAKVAFVVGAYTMIKKHLFGKKCPLA